MNLRRCPRCKLMLPPEAFYANKKGAPRGKCKPCHIAYCAEYYAANKQELVAKASRRYMASPGRAKRAEAAAARSEAAKLRKRAFRAEYEKRPHVVNYRASYKARPERRQRSAELSKRPEKLSRRAAVCRRRRSADPKFLLSGRMSSLIRARLRGVKAGRSWRSMVDYTVDELLAHIERQFLPGMGWHNASRWHIDHIIPVSAFDYTSPEDESFRRCWALSNLRPLWRLDNIRKSARVETLL